ncbi:MAG: hypothetical protein LBM75_06950 [Myxococcales bacterium]|jgi:hypothetical protein|nr:hypothetical protein [Myxococcales bacterium]
MPHLTDRIGLIADQCERRRALPMMVAEVLADGHVSDKERNSSRCA